MTEIQNIEKKANKQIFIGAIMGYIAIGINILSGLLFTPWIIESLGQSQYSLYTLSNSLISLFLIDFGLSATANAFLAKYRANNDDGAIKNFLGLIYKLYLIIDAIIFVVFVVLYFVSPYIYQGLTPSEIEQFQVCFLIFAAFSLISLPTSIFNGIINAYEQIIWIKFLDIVQKLLFIIFTSISIVFEWGLYALVAINAGSNLVIIGTKYLIIRFKLKVKPTFRNKMTWALAKSVLLYSLWAAIEGIFTHISTSISPSILGIVSDSTNIALFGLVSTILYYITLMGNILGSTLLPKLARYYEEGEEVFRKKLLNLSVAIGKVQLVIIMAIILAFGCFGQEFVLIWMRGDSSYLPAYYGILSAIIMQILYLPQLVLRSAMFTTNNVKMLALSAIVKSVICVGLSFGLSYIWGFLGASLAIMISSFVDICLRNYFYLRKLNVSLFTFYKKTYFRMLIVAILCLPIALIMHFYLNFDSAITHGVLYKFLIEGSVFVVLYLALTYFIGLTKNERNIINSKILKIFKKSN